MPLLVRRLLFSAAAMLLISPLALAQTEAPVVEAPVAEAAEEETAGAPTVKVELIEAGQAPLRELRFKPKKGLAQTLEMTMRLNQQITMNGNALPIPDMPRQRFLIDFKVTEITDSGDILFKYEYTKAEVLKEAGVNPAMVAQLEQIITPLKGTIGSGTVSDRGFAKSGDIDIPANVPAQVRNIIEGMRNSMEQMSSPLPEEAVGVGAKWRVSQKVDASGINVKQETIYTLTGFSDEGVSLDVEITQDGEKQEVNSPALPPGASLTLESMDSAGKGAMVLSTDSIIPKSSEISIESDSDMTIKAQGQQQSMQTNMSMEVTLKEFEGEAESE